MKPVDNLETRVAKAIRPIVDETDDAETIARAAIAAVREWDMEQASRFDDVMKVARNIP